MTNQDILQIALQQSAYDCNCAPEDFLSQQNLVTRSRKHALARKYLPLPFACDMVSYGNNIVAQTSEELAGPVAAYLQKGPPFRCLEPPYLHVLDDALEEFGLQVCFMAEYFLPDLHRGASGGPVFLTRIFVHFRKLTRISQRHWVKLGLRERI